MKRSLLFLGSALLVLGGVAACASEDDPQAPAQPVASAQQDQLITGPMGPIFWPTAPITWAGTVGTWPIAVWSPMPINWLAFNVPGATNLAATLTLMDGTAIPNFAATAVPITNAIVQSAATTNWLGGLTPYYGMFPWMYGLNGFPYYGVPGYVFGAGYYPYIGTTLVNPTTPPLIDGLAFPGLLPAGLATTPAGLLTAFPLSFMTPALTSSALFFSTFPAFTATTPFLLNLTFSGITAAQMASVNLFTATAAASAAAASASLQIQATLFPILGVPPVLPAIPPVVLPAIP